MPSTNRFSHMHHSPLSIRLHELGCGIVTDVRVDSNMHSMSHAPETIIEYTIRVNGILNSLEDLEETMLRNPEFEKMKRIIESNPELKDMYEKYKIIDKLKGNI